MSADGSVLIEANLTVDKAEKNLEKLKKNIEKTEDEISKTQKARDEANQEGIFKAAKLDREKAKLSEMRQELQRMREIAKDKSFSDSVRAEAKAAIPGMQTDVAEQSARVRMLQTEYNRASSSVDNYDRKLANAAEKLNEQKQKAGELLQKINSVSKASRKMAEAQDYAEKSAKRFGMRMREVVRSALVFTVITQALAKVREWTGKVIKTNAEATAAFSRLKGALLTLAQPLVEVIIPALVVLLNILTRIVSVAAQLVSFLFGKTITQSKQAAESLNDQAEALENVGGAADKAAGSLTGFDEINTISSGSGGGGGAGAVAPDFGFEATGTEAEMQGILAMIAAIGSALLAWKLSDTFLGGLKMFFGLMLGIGGAITLARNMWDAWQNGLDSGNMLGMLGGAIALVAGLGLAFGSVGAGIGLIISGLALFATAIKDAVDNGWSLNNVLLAVTGLIASGLGISILTGSWVPALAAALAGILLAITTTFGDGEKLVEGFAEILDGLKTFISGVFSGDIEQAFEGIGMIFHGLSTVSKTVLDSIQNMFLSFLDWLDEKTGGRFHGIIEAAKKFIIDFVGAAKNLLGELLWNLELILKGIIDFVTGVFTGDWEKAWTGVKNIFKGVLNGVIALFETMINAIINGLNAIISGIRKLTAFRLPDWMGGYSFDGINIPRIPRANIPRLATGSVVPPNREFMAILGDNKRETEVVSPLSTMKQAFMEAMQESGGFGGGNYKFEIYLNGRKMAVEMVKEVNNMTIEAGKPVLLF